MERKTKINKSFRPKARVVILSVLGIIFLSVCIVLLLFGSLQDKNEDSTSTGTKPPLTTFVMDCNANSFLISDGVCDEETNTEACRYDGGDCCLENKNTELCQTCTCIVVYNSQEVTQLLKANKVKLYIGQKLNKFSGLKTVRDVDSEDGCGNLCLDFSLENERMDSWKYEMEANRTCTCLTFQDCYDECDENEIQSLHNNKILPANGKKVVFVMMTRILPCDRRCFSKNTGYFNPIVTTETRRTSTAEHCQKACRGDEECTHFTWITKDFNDSMFPSSFFDMCTFYKREFGEEIKEAPGKISGPSKCYLGMDVFSEDQVGDGMCDDDMNTEENEFDGGDCCQPNVDCSYCRECQCHNSPDKDMCKEKLIPESCTSSSSRLMVIQGDPSYYSFNPKADVPDVIDVENANLKCSIDIDAPPEVDGWWDDVAIGGLLSGQPVTCRLERDFGYVNQCYKLNQNGTWLHFHDLAVTREDAFGIVIGGSYETLWVTGGHYWPIDTDKEWFDSTEFVKLDANGNQENDHGPTLPYPVSDHCIVDLGNGQMLLNGGYDVERSIYTENDLGGWVYYEDHMLADTWLYSWQDNVWTQGPSLYVQRYQHSCGLVKDSIDERSSIAVVVGGSANIKSSSSMIFPLKETELLTVLEDSTVGNQWSGGPDLPIVLHDTFQATTPDQKQFIIGGGLTRDDHETPSFDSRFLFRLQCFSHKCDWSRMKQELQHDRPKRAVAILLPADSDYGVNCTSTNP